MPEKVTPGPLALSPEMKARLGNMKEDINRARKAIEVLKTLGMETATLEEKLDWSEEVRKTLLKEFG